MKATIVTIGNELLSGSTVNTNLAYIAEKLRSIGIEVLSALTIKDDEALIKKALDHVETSLVIFTGGLGPTKDDLTKETVCDYFQLPLMLHHESLTRIRNYFARMGRDMKETNEKQALFPEEAIILPNQNGTAPGAIFEAKQKTIVLLPGPPSEMQPMFSSVMAYLQGRLPETTVYESGFLVSGIGESEMESYLKDFYTTHSSVDIAPYAGLSEIRYMFIAQDPDALEQALEQFKLQFATYIVGPHDMSLEERVVETLTAQEKTISFVESCTGGLLAGRLVNVPNVSKVFNESYVLYSNEAKIKQLGVNLTIMDKFGAVSDQCVYELAYQLAQRTRSNLTVSISGIAGPSGGTALKPVGTVYFGIYHEGKTKTYHRVFSGDRQMIRHKAVTHALYLILKALMHEDTDS